MEATAPPSRLKILKARGKAAAKQQVARLQDMVSRWHIGDQEKKLADTKWVMAALTQQRAEPLAQAILFDGSFDNPNYFFRYSLLRAALGLNEAREIGLTGPYSVATCSGTMRRLGLSTITAFGGERTSASRRDARRLLAKARRPDDVLAWNLPANFPAATLYDHVLKRQRKASIDLSDPMTEDYVADVLSAITSAERHLDTYRPDLLLLSHTVTPLGASLAWVAAQRRIPSITMFGIYGLPRYWRIDEPSDFWDCMDRPSGRDIESLNPAKAEALANIGKTYLERRLSGHTNDLGSQFAFAQGTTPDRKALADLFGWTEDRPVIAVYSSNWFDYPHAMGMNRFRDFLDWILATKQAAIESKHAYWLFRAHPVDQWYGGVTLKDVLPATMAHHVRLAPMEWSGTAVTRMADALVTYHGTAGIEYAALGKPVLVADRGWYHDCGFVTFPNSREEYLSMLVSNWWDATSPSAVARRANIFAGWYFCAPSWQNGLVMEDDSRQGNLYAGIIQRIQDCPEAIGQEISTIRNWFLSGERLYHTYKMRLAESYSLSNIEG
jgi:hypothetical protein